MKFHDEQPKTRGNAPPSKLDPYKKLEQFFESSPQGMNKDVVLEYVNLIVDATHNDQGNYFDTGRSFDGFSD